MKELLRSKLKMAGGQAAFSRKTDLSRAKLNKFLHGKRALTKRIIKLLKLRVAYVPEKHTRELS